MEGTYSPHSTGSSISDTLSFPQSYAGNARYQALSTELRSLLFAATREPSPETNAPSEPPVPASQRPQPARSLAIPTPILTRAQLQRYMRTWVVECAPWLDMFDQARTFGLNIPCLAQRSGAVLYAMLALSARQQERVSATEQSHQSIELYSEAIAALSSSLDARQPSTLATACILCVLEMMSASPQDWRRHLEGCAALFASAGIHGLSGGPLQAIFWCYARMDLCNALISEGSASTVIPVQTWLPQQQGSATRAADVWREIQRQQGPSPDMYANYAVYLTGQVCDLLATRTLGTESHGTCSADDHNEANRWELLWDDLQSWNKDRPRQLLPIKTATDTRLFPYAFYAHYAAISANQLYHTACILMLDMCEHRDDVLAVKEGRTELWHARCVVGISLANSHRGCLNNAIQPLYIAGRLFSHREEHAVIVALLRQIEAGSGWAARWRVHDLERAWGYSAGTFCVQDGVQERRRDKM